MTIDTNKGQIIISENFIISKQTRLEEIFDFFDVGKFEVYDSKTGHSYYIIRGIKIGGKYFSFSFHYFNSQITSVLWGFNDLPNVTWDDYSQEKELKMRNEYDNWLTQHIGTERNFSWGRIGAYFDFKNGMSEIALVYL